MRIKELQKQIADVLAKQETICNILESDYSLLIGCNDASGFLINIFESKYAFIHSNSNDEEIEKYLRTHSEEEFATDLLKTIQGHPAFFLYFMLLTRLEEHGIIDEGLFHHMMGSIVSYEPEFDEFLIKILSHYNLN